MLKLAWSERPGLAIQIAIRSQSPALMNEIRSILLKDPEKAINEPDALQILLQDGLSSDISSQLKVRWSYTRRCSILLTSLVSSLLGAG